MEVASTAPPPGPPPTVLVSDDAIVRAALAQQKELQRKVQQLANLEAKLQAEKADIEAKMAESEARRREARDRKQQQLQQALAQREHTRTLRKGASMIKLVANQNSLAELLAAREQHKAEVAAEIATQRRAHLEAAHAKAAERERALEANRARAVAEQEDKKAALMATMTVREEKSGYLHFLQDQARDAARMESLSMGVKRREIAVRAEALRAEKVAEIRAAGEAAALRLLELEAARAAETEARTAAHRLRQQETRRQIEAREAARLEAIAERERQLKDKIARAEMLAEHRRAIAVQMRTRKVELQELTLERSQRFEAVLGVSHSFAESPGSGHGPAGINGSWWGPTLQQRSAARSASSTRPSSGSVIAVEHRILHSPGATGSGRGGGLSPGAPGLRPSTSSGSLGSRRALAGQPLTLGSDELKRATIELREMVRLEKEKEIERQAALRAAVSEKERLSVEFAAERVAARDKIKALQGLLAPAAPPPDFRV